MVAVGPRRPSFSCTYAIDPASSPIGSSTEREIRQNGNLSLQNLVERLSSESTGLGGCGSKVLPVGSARPSFFCTQETDRNFGRNRCDHRPKLLTNTSTSLTRWMFRKPHTASAHLVCKTRRVEARFQSNVVEKAPSGSAAVAAGHLNPPTPGSGVRGC